MLSDDSSGHVCSMYLVSVCPSFFSPAIHRGSAFICKSSPKWDSVFPFRSFDLSSVQVHSKYNYSIAWNSSFKRLFDETVFKLNGYTLRGEETQTVLLLPPQ